MVSAGPRVGAGAGAASGAASTFGAPAASAFGACSFAGAFLPKQHLLGLEWYVTFWGCQFYRKFRMKS